MEDKVTIKMTLKCPVCETTWQEEHDSTEITLKCPNSENHDNN